MKIRKTPTLLTYKWEMILLLWLAFFFNQADRQIFNVVLPAIRSDLNLADSDMGLVASILILVYGILVPVAGYVGDRSNKKYVLMFSLLIWSTSTLFSGMSTMLIHLIFLQSIATGGGEAFYSPSANAMIGEHHDKTRATAMSIHQTALYAGIIMSGYLAGWIADQFGWRVAFYVFGGLGIILSLIIAARLKDSLPVNTAGNKVRLSDALNMFFRKPTALLLTGAFAGMVFVNVGFMTWMPTYLHEKFGFSLARSGFDATFYHYVAAFIGVLLGASLADRFSNKVTGMRGIVQGTGLLLGAPFIFWLGIGNTPFLVYLALAFFGIFRGVYDSNIFAALYDVVEPRFRSTATGLMLMFAFITGASAPYILGKIKPILGLAWGLSALSVVYIAAALCIFIAVRFYYKKDIIK
ncbi:MAG TPA: MFS transporter [Petrimonas sp.]|nr:MFS transporter [Petrimonas sp.]